MEAEREKLGLKDATRVGVGAIVGGGILVLAGTAFNATGPSAIIAFMLNGLVALLTALSFAEISTSFPESGGAYTFAKKVLSVRAAFGVGWILWFAYVVAGVLYALGFAAYGALLAKSIWEVVGDVAPSWLMQPTTGILLAVLATIGYALSLIRKSTGGGQWATDGKVAVFIVLILAGIVALFRQSPSQSIEALTPFFSDGGVGLLAAMGYTFIALQGFDLISTIAGEIKDPEKNIPKAMLISLGTALAVYIPLLFLVSTVGVSAGENIGQLARSHPETVVALAAREYMGAAGYWLVIIAAVMATLSALHANLLAASRVALSMARDHTLPPLLATMHSKRQTPVVAIYASALTMLAIIMMVDNLASAGAAASLIFLVSFALTHATAFLARTRNTPKKEVFRTPWFPLVPLLGGSACAGLALFQAINVPSAGLVALFWLGLGSLLYWGIFSESAERVDASMEGADPVLVQLRGRSPFVLLPVANPAHAKAMVGIANALAPSRFGRVLLLSVVTDHEEKAVQQRIQAAQEVVREALVHSYEEGHTPEALITRAENVWEEIRRVAAVHQCESLLLGLGLLGKETVNTHLTSLINDIGCDIALMKSPPHWEFNKVQRILVPIAGRGREHEIRARFLGSICREANREVTFISILPESASESEIEQRLKNISRLVDVKLPARSTVEIARSNDAANYILKFAENFDLVVLGLGKIPKANLLDNPALRIAHECPCASILLSRRPSRFIPNVFESESSKPAPSHES